MRVHLIVPPIRGPNVGCTQGSSVRHREDALKPLDFSNGLVGVHASLSSSTKREAVKRHSTNAETAGLPSGAAEKPISRRGLIGSIVLLEVTEGRKFRCDPLEFGKRRIFIDRQVRSRSRLLAIGKPSRWTRGIEVPSLGLANRRTDEVRFLTGDGEFGAARGSGSRSPAAR
jgi:hypothetical protein